MASTVQLTYAHRIAQITIGWLKSKTAASVRGNTQFDETILDGSLVAPPHTAGKLLPKELWPPVIDLLTVEGYETALGAALGDDLNAPI